MRRAGLFLCLLLLALPASAQRARDLGIEPGIFEPGTHNAITDVAGVRVGHRTLIEGDSVRTGVTAIVPHEGDVFNEKVPAAVYVGNGFGKAAGFLQVQELGSIETPIVLTNTLSVGTALDAVVRWTLERHPDVRSVNAVVGETNDAYLNDIRGLHVTTEDVWAAIDSAASGPVAEGNVGAGTGTTLFGWKGGIGTASRVLPASLGGYTVGVLIQGNYGGVLTIDGRRVGEALGQYSFRDHVPAGSPSERDGSCMIVIATDAPVSPRNLERMARRAVLGLARTGSFMSNGSGDFVIAFSTQNRSTGAPVETVQNLANHRMSPLFLGTIEAVEEAVYNALVAAETMQGAGGRVREAISLK
ncbi:MAG: P1 family peptidase [Bacteroidota bacterium]